VYGISDSRPLPEGRMASRAKINDGLIFTLNPLVLHCGYLAYVLAVRLDRATRCGELLVSLFHL
jgi:hypothetical protein